MKMVPKNWSDHASMMVLLKEQPSLAPHVAPALSSRNMKQFNEDPRQKKLTALFSKGIKSQASTASQETKVAEGMFHQDVVWSIFLQLLYDLVKYNGIIVYLKMCLEEILMLSREIF